jgi:hypothetical protein
MILCALSLAVLLILLLLVSGGKTASSIHQRDYQVMAEPLHAAKSSPTSGQEGAIQFPPRGILPMFFDFECIGGPCPPYDEKTGRADGPITWTIPKAADFATEYYKQVVMRMEKNGPKTHRKQW